MSFLLALIVLLFINDHEVNAAPGVTYYVSTTGDDSNNGSMATPFKTLNKARDVIRHYKHTGSHQLPAGGVLVYIRGGTYTQTNFSMYNQTLLDLSSQDDSGTTSTPIIWTCYPTEKCILTGGYQIPSTSFVESTAYPSLLVADLKKINTEWNNIEFGTIGSGSLGQCQNIRSELFVNGERMVLSRWPNIYYQQSEYPGLPIWNWTQISKVTNGNSFTYTSQLSSRANTWSKEVSSANIKNSPWLHGYWSYDWADSYVQIQSIDTSSETITTYSNTPPVYGYKDNARYYGVNLLSELDTINEYYIDTINKLVYISKERQNTLSSDIYIISVNPYIIKIAGFGEPYGRSDYWNDVDYLSSFVIPPSKYDVQYKWIPPKHILPGPDASSIQYVTISNLTILSAISGGLIATDVSNCNFNNLIISGIGETGMTVTGYNNTAINNKITNIGCTGLDIGGGDYNSLTYGNNICLNNNISYHAQWHRTYVPSIAFSGVGNKYIGNIMQYGPHTATTGACTDCLFESNFINLMCYEVSDAGAWYSGRSWIHRHNTIYNNTFTNIHNIEKVVLGYPSVEAVYFDDQLCDGNITNNIFINCQAAMLLGGGRRIEVHNNYYASCPTAVLYDNRGMKNQQSYCKPGGTFNQQLDSVNYKQPPWSKAFPYLPNVFNEQPCVPVYDHITNNKYCCGKASGCKFIDDSATTCESWNSTCDNNQQVNWSNEYC